MSTSGRARVGVALVALAAYLAGWGRTDALLTVGFYVAAIALTVVLAVLVLGGLVWIERRWLS